MSPFAWARPPFRIEMKAGGLDTLPHSPGLFLMFAVLGLEHKIAYRHVFWTSVIIPCFVVGVATVLAVMFGF